MRISWTPRAKRTYFKVLDYLKEEWTEKEIENFVHETEQVISQIRHSPLMFEASKMRKNIRKGFVTPQNMMLYRIKPRKKEIELLMFWDNRKDDQKRPY